MCRDTRAGTRVDEKAESGKGCATRARRQAPLSFQTTARTGSGRRVWREKTRPALVAVARPRNESLQLPSLLRLLRSGGGDGETRRGLQCAATGALLQQCCADEALQRCGGCRQRVVKPDREREKERASEREKCWQRGVVGRSGLYRSCWSFIEHSTGVPRS